ncbi:MAG: hypothetical protein K2X28_06920 [Alphaproteobacteria bacterium]|nr:hypothetical protein [Alphaproteobacteria bacterium]
MIFISADFIFINGLYVIGFLFASLIIQKEKNYFISIVSIFIGIFLFFIIGFFMILIFGIIYWKVFLLIGLILSSVFLILIYLNNSLKKRMIGLFTSLFVLNFLIFIFNKYDFNLFCGDTFILTRNALNFSSNSRNIAPFANWGPFYPVIQYINNELGNVYSISLQPLFLLSFTLIFQKVTYKALIASDVNKMASLLTSISSSLVVITSPIFLNITLLIHTNAIFTYYLFMFVAFYWLGEAKKEKGYYYLCYLFLFAGSATRVESSIYLTIFFLCMLFKNSLHYESLKFLFTNQRKKMIQGQTNKKIEELSHLDLLVAQSFFLVMGTWYATQYLLGLTSEILNPSKSLFLALLYIGLALSFFAHRIVLFSFIRNNFLTITLIILLIFLPILLIMFNDIFSKNKNTIINNLSTDYWKGVRIFTVASLSFLCFRQRKRILLDSSILIAFGLMVLSIFIFGLFRIPYNNGLYDSSNRLLVALIPIAIFYLTLKVNVSQPLPFLHKVNSWFKRRNLNTE